MSKDKGVKGVEEMDDQLWFQRHVKGELQRFDKSFEAEAEAPSIKELESFIGEHKSSLRRKQWKELWLFWLTALLLLGGAGWLWTQDVIWFVTLQIAASWGGILFLGIMHWRRKGSGGWKSS
ncbi:DUF5345 family protein [Paenibacillus sp. J5C_2022]|uniref:DUF5345 family protein n=1 Tax=Paenibacillus sp. J5C2022 TaxID=2977129 RepID=UPI0021D0B71F|nr:DUF5345 family protein [Paenibacillus sp. J5C2022]MCU6712527.1 DUF5345 family protein [Paenibacillus sp. J5C2022]